MAKSHGEIIDYQSGKVRILEDKCEDCIFRPGNLMHLNPGRLREVVEANLAASALLTCHNTLPGNDAGANPAACRGFWDSHGLKTAAGRIAKFVIGIFWVSLEELDEQHSTRAQGDRRHEPEEAED